jgi:hypothetical protein
MKKRRRRKGVIWAGYRERCGAMGRRELVMGL